MYAAYQSHQSCGGATASNSPCRIDVSCRSCESSATSISVVPDAPGNPGRELLEQPGVAVRVAERRIDEVRAPWDRFEPWRPALVRLGDVDAPADQLAAGGLDVLDGEDQPVGGSGSGLREALADVDRALGARRRELDSPDRVAGAEVGVQAPAEALVEALRPI